MKIRYNCTYVTTEFCHGRKGGLGEIESYRWMRVKIQEGSEYEYAATRAQARYVHDFSRLNAHSFQYCYYSLATWYILLPLNSSSAELDYKH